MSPLADPAVGGAFALGALEFDKVRGMLAARTSFSAGRELALALEPSPEIEIVERLQATTEEARRLPTLKPGLTLGGARDVRPIAQRAALGGLLQPVELLDVAASARVARLWRSTLLRLGDSLPNLALVSERLGEHRPLIEEIGRAIVDSGEVSDDASPRLRQLRSELRTAQDRLLARLQELLHSPAVRPALQDAVITQRNGRYALPVRADERQRVKGIVHDQSASGATLFVEPLPIVEAGNRLRQLEAEERHEVERILRALSTLVSTQRDVLDLSVGALAELDLQMAKGRLADDQDAVRPGLLALPRSGSGPVLRLLDARHPLLGGDVVPLTLELGGAFDVLVITGPNTGGKTVALKTVGVLALMAQSGLQVPAGAGSELGVFRAIHADIGDEQSIEQSLSTFSSHLTHIIAMLGRLGACSLVLLDEIGAGTDPQEGSALARAILTYLSKRGAYAIATTHYSELKAFAHATPRVENASVEFDDRTLAPTYRLLVGVPGRSNALAIAARLGLPGELVRLARTLLDPASAEADALLAEIQRDRDAAAAANREAQQRADEAEQLRRHVRDQLRQTERERREILQRARGESEQLLAELRREADRRIRDLGSLGPDPRPLRDAARSINALGPLPEPEVRSGIELDAEPPEAVVVRPGAELVVARLGVPGMVVEVAPNGDAELDVRGMRVRVPAAELAEARPANRRERAEVRHAAPTGPVIARGDAAPTAPPTELDLRGLRRDEAAETLDRYLNDAYLSGLRAARVIHGKGSGAVRAAVREQLRDHPLVSTFSAADARTGGDGVTEVMLAS